MCQWFYFEGNILKVTIRNLHCDVICFSPFKESSSLMFYKTRYLKVNGKIMTCKQENSL